MFQKGSYIKAVIGKCYLLQVTARRIQSVPEKNDVATLNKLLAPEQHKQGRKAVN